MARKYTELDLLHFIELYLDGNSYQTLVEKHGFKLSYKNFSNYVKKYERHGLEGIKYQKKNRTYTREFKLKVVLEHLENDYGAHYLANKYNIPSHNTVKNWINRYTKGKENETYSPNSEVYNIIDRGSQYTSHAFNKVIKDNDLIHSMSRVSKCIDNGPIEGFWGTLKVEMFNLDTFDTPKYLDQKIKEYVEFFNNKRVTLDMGLAIPTEEEILQMIA